MDMAIADPNHPNLRVGNALAQLVACFELIGIDHKLCTFDVNCCELALIIGLQLGADILLVNGVPTSSELFFAVPTLSGCHEIASSHVMRMPTVPLYPN